MPDGTQQGRPLRRSEAKELTRRRLLDAALGLLDEKGERGLSASAISRAAGIAQSSFYVHFRDKEDLLSALGDEVLLRLRSAVRQARRRSRERPTDKEDLRATFRIPLEGMAAHPALFRLMQRARHDPSSPLGTSARELNSGNRRELIDDLTVLGYPMDSERQRRRVAMIAEGYVALTETLAMGHIDGRYPDVEEIVDMLLWFAAGPASLLPTSPWGFFRKRPSADTADQAGGGEQQGHPLTPSPPASGRSRARPSSPDC